MSVFNFREHVCSSSTMVACFGFLDFYRGRNERTFIVSPNCSVHIFSLQCDRKSNQIELHVISLQSLSINTKPKNSIWCCGRRMFPIHSTHSLAHVYLNLQTYPSTLSRCPCVCERVCACTGRSLAAAGKQFVMRKLHLIRECMAQSTGSSLMHRPHTYTVAHGAFASFAWKFDMTIRNWIRWMEN